MKENTPKLIRLGLPGVVPLAIDIGVCFATVHVFRTPGYSVVGHMRDILPTALAFNIASQLLILFPRFYSAWTRRFVSTYILDAITSLLPFILIRCLRIPAPDARMKLFGLAYALFIFSKACLLMRFALANVSDEHSRRPLSVWIFLSSLSIYSAMSPWLALACWPTADEPAYLLLSHSLAVDHDFDMANNYRQRDYKLFFPPDPDTLDHHTWRNDRGQEFPVHDIGTSVLLVPGYSLAGRLGAMLEMNLLAALLVLGIYTLGYHLGANQRGALACWVLFAFTSPIVVYSSQIYPEVIGATCCIWAVIAFAKFIQEKRALLLISAGSLLGVLPWFSIRYWIILGPLGLSIALYVLFGYQVRITRRLQLLSLLALPGASSFTLFMLFDERHYGTILPNAGYILLIRGFHMRMFTHTPHIGLLGLLLDRAYGILPTAPVYLIAVAGISKIIRRKRWEATSILSSALIYMLFAAFNYWWYGGWAPPSRYIFLSMALLAPVAALILSKCFEYINILLAGWSFVIAVAYTAFPSTRYTFWDVNTGSLSQFGRQNIGIDFGWLFPSFIRASAVDYELAALWMGMTFLYVWLSRPKLSPSTYSR
jgi:hypothetical protein